jgi:predicted nucleic acid-binding protein
MVSIYIDTNVFLDFYQSATDRMGIFQELRERVDCIVVPEQTVREFRRNRAARLKHLADHVEKAANVNVHTTAIVRELPDFEKWVEARDVVKNHARAIATKLRAWARDESSDPVYQEFIKLYTHGTIMSTPKDALGKAQARKLLGDPPTSSDKQTVGDEVIWETLLALCDNDLIIVSRDRTFLDNESLLKSEFNIDGKRRLLAVTDSLGLALKLVGKPSTPIEQAEKERGQHEVDARKALETGRCPKCDVEMDEDGYEGGEGDSAWWLTCPKCNLVAFPVRDSQGAKGE